MSRAVGNWRSRTFASLANGNYRKFFFSQAVSLTGTWMQSVALAWLVLQLTDSVTWLGLAIALQSLPILLLGPYGGLLVDRLDKRHLLIGTQITSGAQALILGVLTVTGTVTLEWVLALSLGLGLINAIENPGRQAFVREMVPVDMVRNAVSLNSVLVNVARAVGPAVAGVLIATTGLATCFFINSATFLVAIGAFVLMKRSELTPTEPVPRGPGQLREGLRYVCSDPHLFIPLVMMAMVGTLTYEFQVSLPALATITFGGGAASIGIITAAMGTGAVIGGLLSAGRTTSGIRTMVLAALAFGGSVLLVVMAPTLTLAAVALVSVGAASIWFLSTANSTLQLTAVPQMRGRVMALWTVAFIGTTPIGGPIVGFIAQNAGPRWALALGSIAAFSAAGLGAVTLTRLSNPKQAKRTASEQSERGKVVEG
jgi:MFS family permease